MAKHQSIKGLGRELYFTEPPKQEGNIQVKQHTDKTTKQQGSTERATFYIRPEQSDQLEMLKVKLRAKLRGQRDRQVDKSELIRLAIDLLCEQDDDLLIKRLTSK